MGRDTLKRSIGLGLVAVGLRLLCRGERFLGKDVVDGGIDFMSDILQHCSGKEPLAGLFVGSFRLGSKV